MDPFRFDELARTLATAGTRRRLLALVATLPLAGLLHLPAADEAEAERPHERIHRRNKQHHRKRRNQTRRRHANHNKHRNQGGKGVGNPNACTPNGQTCNQNSDCCGNNCFNQVCAQPVSQCAGVGCQAGAAGCCPSGCCEPPTNQCNGVGECCAPNCAGKRCGPDGCGNTGTCGTCPSGGKCDETSGQCTCTPQTCPNGCCDANVDCQPGDTVQQCGSGGIACYQCGPNQYCSTETGTCRDNPPCSAATCPNGCCNLENGIHVCRTDLRGCGPGGPCCNGCCDENDECQDGDDDGACGAGGSRCVACNPLDRCDQGRCQCDANNCPGCCDNGPGNPGFCEQGNTNDFCGFGGVLCVACPTGTTCNGQGKCTCINTNEFCGSGDHCIACPDGFNCTAQGQCVCTAQSCTASSGRSCQNIGFGIQCLCDWDYCHGCCEDGLCKGGGNTAEACRTDAGACTACPPGQNCVAGILGLKACCPAGSSACDIGLCCPDSQYCCDGNCCDTPCCALGTACCPRGVDCCNDTCCTPGYPRCCDADGNGTYECVSVC